MKYFALFLSLIFLTTFNTSCDSKVEEKKSTPIYADYYFRYLASDKTFKAEASFFEREAKKKKPIVMPAVYFNKTPMNARNLPSFGTKYRIEKTNEPAPTLLDFECVDEKEQKRSFQTMLKPISKLKLDAPIQKSKGFSLNWEGLPLSDQEELVFLFIDKEQNGFTETLKGPTQTASIQFPMAKTSKLQLGSGQLTLVRKNNQLKKVDELNISITTEFYANSIPIEVIE